MRPAPEGGTAAAATVADILTQFLKARGLGLGVTEIGKSLGISKAVVHRILLSLEDRGLVSFDAERRLYLLGPSLLALGATAFQTSDLRVVSLPTIAQLQLETRATSTLSVLVGTKRMFLDQVVSSEELKVSVETGRLAPLHVGASGRAMLAFAPPRVQDQVIEQELDRHTSNTITDPADLRSSLEQVRQDGFAVSRGEHTKVSGAVACPILAPNGFSIGAISACGPVETYTDKRVTELIPRVQHAAETVARLLAPRLHPGPRLH